MNAAVGHVRHTCRKRSQIPDAALRCETPFRTLRGTGEVGDATFILCVAELKQLSILPVGNLPAESQHVSVDLNRQHRKEDDATIECLAALQWKHAHAFGDALGPHAPLDCVRRRRTYCRPLCVALGIAVG